MIRYALRCAKGHDFDGWFASSDTYDALKRAGQVSCSICGDTGVEKALMAPSVRPARKAEAAAAQSAAQTAPQPAPQPAPIPAARPGPVPGAAGPQPQAGRPMPSLAHPSTPLEKAIAELRRRVEESSDYVGGDFAAEARRIHEGEADDRPIWGEASLADAKALSEDGIPVAPLPFMRRRDD